MASGMGKFVAQKNHLGLQTNDTKRMPPPPLNLIRSNNQATGPNSSRLAPSNLAKFSTGRSIPKVSGSGSGTPQQSPLAGAKKVIEKLGGVGGRGSPQPQFRQNGREKNGEQQGEHRDKFDTDLESTTGSEGSVDTLNAVDHNMTRVKGEAEEYEDEEGDDGQGPYEDDEDEQGQHTNEAQNGYVGQDGQYYQNGPVDHGEQIDGDEREFSEDGEEEEDDEDMAQQEQTANGGYNGQYQQPQQYTQAIQQQQGRDFEDIPVRGGSPNNLTTGMANARNSTYAPASRMNSAQAPQTFGYQQQEEQYGGRDNFGASTIADDESGSDEETDEDQPNQELDGYGEAPQRPQYQNQLQVHQQQQQYAQQQRPRQPNPVLGQEKPVYQRVMEHKGLTGGGNFAPTELGDETTTLDSPVPVPQKKTKAKEKRRASPSPLVRKRAPSPELDYDKPTLYNMPYSELADQPFETKPPRQRPSTVVVKGKTLSEKLDKAMQLSNEQKEEFLSSLSIKDWEEAGGWFVTRFGDVMTKFVELRKERRAMADAFEKRLEERNGSVQRGSDKLQSEMGEMRKGGQSILRGKSPGLF